MTDSPTLPRPPRNAVLQGLIGSYAVFRDCQPLAIGIHKTIRQQQPDLGEGALRLALRLHTTSVRYLKAVANGSQRFDLEGQLAGEITAEQKSQALVMLKERFRKGAERKRGEAQEKERQAQEEKQRQKLQQLADKFNRR